MEDMDTNTYTNQGEQHHSSKPNTLKIPDQQQCVRDGKRWRCSNIAISGSLYCHQHHLERDAYNKKRRKGPKIENRYITHLPSGDLRCRKTGKRWQCHDKATSGLYCHKHGLYEDVRNKNRRKGGQRPNRALMTLLSISEEQPKFSANDSSNTAQLIDSKLIMEGDVNSNVGDAIPKPNSNDGVRQVTSSPVESGEPTMQQQQCHQGGKRGDCLQMASPGKLYCDMHQLKRDASNKMTRKTSKKQRPADGRCRRAGKGWRCKEKASPGIYCETHRKKGPKRLKKIEDVRGSNIREGLSKPNANDCGKEESTGTGKPGREATKRQGGRKRSRVKETISTDLVLGLGKVAMKKCRGVSVNDEHEESGLIVSPDNGPTGDSNMEITSRDATMKFQARGLLSVTNCDMAFEEHTSTCEQVHIEKISDVVNEDPEKTHAHVDIGKFNQIEGIGPDNISITCVKSPLKCQNSQNLSHEDQLQYAIEDDQNDAIMLPFWSDYNTCEELQEKEDFSFLNDGAMNAIDFSFVEMEAEEDIMEVLRGVQSNVYVGDILIPAEYEQIYKEIKDLHGPLENGESVGEKRSISHAALVELLKVVRELEGLTMDSMTETTILNFERTVAVGKLFNYNVGWLDENLKRLRDLYAKHCAVGGELEQVERKITEEKTQRRCTKI